MAEYQDLLSKARGRHAPDMVRLADWIIRNDPLTGITDPAAYRAAMGKVVEALESFVTSLTDGGKNDDRCLSIMHGELTDCIRNAAEALASARAAMGKAATKE